MWRLAVPWLQEFVFQPDDWRFYALGLLAASLLPVRTKWADQGVSLTLGVLWGLLALRAADDESMWWATFALLECGWFLGLGTIGRRLEFKTRNGAWAIIGTCFVIYSLFLLPVLGYFEIIQEPAYGIPFPLVLFTCGTLFFAAGWTTNLALVLPILWALFGGPSSDLVEVVGLQVALLTATFFFLLPSELRGGSDRRSPGASYKYAYKGRAVFGYGLWIAVLTCTFLTFLTVAKRVPEPWIDILPVVTTNLALLSVLGIALWLAFPAWQSLWYRYVAWWLFRGVGRIWVWFQGAWRW